MPTSNQSPKSPGGVGGRSVHCDKPFVRSFAIAREQIDVEKRTVELSFSSETKDVERWFGVEVLDHSPDSVRMARLHAGAPLLFNHERDQHLGVIDGARIERGRGKAVVRFGNSALAEEKFRDVQDGILNNVSCTYVPRKMVLEEERDDAPSVYRVTDWEPLEISLVTIPADISVGVGRQAGQLTTEPFDIEIEERTMPIENEESREVPVNTPAKSLATPAVDLVAERGRITSEVRSEERKRVADLVSMGSRYAQYDGAGLAERHIAEGKTVEQFRQAILEQLPSSDKAGTKGEAPSDLPLTERDVQEYSLVRAIAASVSNDWSKAGFELECSREIEERLGRDARGFFVPMQVQQRAMNVTTGADLVGTDHLSSNFIDTLRPLSVAIALGATVLPDLQGTVSIPKKTGNSAFTWLADDGDAVDSDPAFGSVVLSPKTIAGAVPMSRRLLKQSSPSIESLVLGDLQQGAALGIDLGALEGTAAANQPRGIVNQVGVNTQAVADVGGAPTWAELVGFETAVADDNSLSGSLAYVTTSGVRGGLKVTPKDAGSGRFLMEGNEANGYPVAVRNGLTAKRIIFGNWSDLLIGMWGILDVMPDPAAKAAAGGLVIRVFQDIDIAVRHPESFCINA